jgi:protein-tyrosine phosphatase
MVYRSGAMYRLTASAWEWMAERKIRTVCDLRSLEEQELAPTIWQGGNHPRHAGVAYEADLLLSGQKEFGKTGMNEMHDSLYPVFPKLLAPSLKAMFEALLEAHTPLIVHCSAGQDRTGLAIGLLLSALGVPRTTILEDYRLSTQCRRIENELDHRTILAFSESNAFARYYAEVIKKRGAAAFRPRELVNRHGQPLLLDAFAAIEDEWGSVPTYLETELGLRREDILRLQKLCLTETVTQ